MWDKIEKWRDSCIRSNSSRLFPIGNGYHSPNVDAKEEHERVVTKEDRIRIRETGAGITNGWDLQSADNHQEIIWADLSSCRSWLIFVLKQTYHTYISYIEPYYFVPYYRIV